MSIPAKHRDALAVQCEGRLTLTKHPHGCLLFFPRPVWESHREQIAAWPMAAPASVFIEHGTITIPSH